MADTKVYTIKINGIEQAISNVEELENAVEQLQNEFKSADFGSEQYKKLQGDLINAKSKLKEIDEATEGLTSHQKLEAIAGLGEAITGAFAAGAVIESFISDTEIAAKTQEKLEQALVLVQSARAIAEGVKQAAILKTIAIQKLQSLSTKADTVAEVANSAAKNASSLSIKNLGSSIKGALPQLSKFGLVGAAVAAATAQIGGAAYLSANNFSDLGKSFKEASIPMKALMILLSPIIIGFTNLRMIFGKISEKSSKVGEFIDDAKESLFDFIGVETEAAKASRLAAESFANQREEQEKLDASTKALTDATINLTKANIANANSAIIVANALKNQQLEEANNALKQQQKEIEQLIELYSKYGGVLESTGVGVNDLQNELNKLKTEELNNQTEIVTNLKSSAEAIINLKKEESDKRSELIQSDLDSEIEANNLKGLNEKKLAFESQKLDEQLTKFKLDLIQKRLNGLNGEKDAQYVLQKINNGRIDDLLKEIDNNELVLAESTKINKEKIKLAEELDKKESDLEIKRIERLQKGIDKQKEAIEAAFLILNTLKNGSKDANEEAQKLLATIVTTNDEIQNLLAEAFKDNPKPESLLGKLLGISDEKAEELESVLNQSLDNMLSAIETFENNRLEILNESIAEREEIISDLETKTEESLSRIADLENNLTNSRLDNRDAILKSIEKEQQKIKDLELAKKREFAEQQKLAAEVEKIEERRIRRQKAISIAETIQNTAVGIMNIFAKQGDQAFPFPIKLGFAALLGLTGAAQIAAISSSGFAEGGFTGKGDKYEPAGIVHKGEYVIPKWIVESPSMSSTISTIENKRLKGYAEGGLVENNISLSNDFSSIENRLKSLEETLLNRPTIVSVESIDRVRNNKINTEIQATL